MKTAEEGNRHRMNAKDKRGRGKRGWRVGVGSSDVQIEKSMQDEQKVVNKRK